MKSKRSQKEIIKAILLSGRSLTMKDAILELNCYRLQARIAELRQEGMKIITEMVYGGISQLSGMPIYYAKYSLRK